MRYRIFITDFDGTLAHQGRVAMATWNRIGEYRRAGGRVVIATGRRLDDLMDVFPAAAALDAIVAENGAVVHWPESGEIHFLGSPPPPEALAALRELVPHAGFGQVIQEGIHRDLPDFKRWADRFGLKLDFQLNKHTIMAMPAGVNKATGVTRVLDRWSLDWGQAAGAGDAENDLPFMMRCALRATVANALPQVKLAAHFVAQTPATEGLQEVLEHLQSTK